MPNRNLDETFFNDFDFISNKILVSESTYVKYLSYKIYLDHV